ncbi:MAG: XRE family transcriptional regulator, partial [Saprospiraceae bacterium]
MTQNYVAIHVGVTMEAVTYWEKGTTPQIQYVPRIVSFLGYDPFVREGNSLVDLVWNYQRKHGLS